jgi:ABC-2 type transport system ATP-binding protein
VQDVVAASGLTKRFGKVTAVEELSFALAPGTVTGFLGPNGAGKTTTLRMLLGLAQPDRGTAEIFGHPYAQLPRAGRRVGAVLEAADAHPGRSGRDHLLMLATATGTSRARVDDVLALVELRGAARRRVKGYSLGMRQRLGLATALLSEPELLVLDEPANGLDPEGVRWLRDFLRAFSAGGGTVFVSSHILAEVAQTVDRVLIVNHGRLVADSPLDELTRRVAGAVVVRTPAPERLTAALAAEGVDVGPAGDERLRVVGVASDRVGDIAFAAGVPLHELATESQSLEDVFFALTAAEPEPEPEAGR